MKKGGIITTLFSLVLFLAGALILIANYLEFPGALAPFRQMIIGFAYDNLSLTSSTNSAALLIPGVFLILEAVMMLCSRKRSPYTVIFSLYLIFVYFTLVVQSHVRLGLETPSFIISHIAIERRNLISILVVLEAMLAILLLYLTGSMNQKYRERMEILYSSEDIDNPHRAEQNPYMSRSKRKKIEAKEKKREEKREAKEKEKEEKRNEKLREKEEREAERAEREARILIEREEKKAQKKEERKKRKEEKKRLRDGEEVLPDEDVDAGFNTNDLAPQMPMPDKAISMDRPLEFPEFSDVPRLSTIEHSEDIDIVAPDPRVRFKEAMGLDKSFGKTQGGTIEVPPEVYEDDDEEDSSFEIQTRTTLSDMPKYDPSKAGSHFKKGGILEATIESMNSYENNNIERPKSPILGLDSKFDAKEEITSKKDRIAPSTLSKDHPRYKLFESLRNTPARETVNVSHIPSRKFKEEKRESIDNSFSPYQSTFKREEEQKSKLSERLDAMKRESISTSNPLVSQEPAKLDEEEKLRRENEELKAKLEMLNSTLKKERKEPSPTFNEEAKPEPIKAEDIMSIDEKHKGRYDEGPSEEEMKAQENEIYYSVGIAGLSSNDEGMTGIKRRSRMHYQAPSMDILLDYPSADREIDEYTISRGQMILSTLHDFKVDVTLDNIVKGPTVTMYELKLAEGVPVSKIKTRYDDLQYALGVRSIRILAPVPGKQAVGIEVPNSKRATIGFKDMLYTFNALPDKDKMAVPMILGRTITGEPVSINVAKAPHLLIAGSTGSGKSVGINSLIATILYNRSPQEVRLIMVDPKVVELKIYNGIPHLLTPVITESKKVQKVLAWLTEEMDRRYNMISRFNVRNIEAFNEKLKREKLAAEKLPYIVLIMDEYADLMSTIGKDIEYYVGRLAAMARAVGIHLVLATQRPSAEVVTGTIKNNIPSRIAFAVASGVNSKIILDEMGAESLLGKGDMLYKSPSSIETQRIQGAFLSDGEVEKIVEQVKLNGEADYLDESIFEDHDEKEDDFDDDDFDYIDSEEEEYERAKQIVYEKKSASASYLQRRMKIGYNKAARYVERMEEDGIVGPPNGSKPRELIKMV